MPTTYTTIIYQMTINGDTYIGSTNNFNRRLLQHKHSCETDGNVKYNLPVYKKIREYGGFLKIKWDIIDIIFTESKSLSVQKELEQSYIDKHKPTLNTHSAFQPYKNKSEYDKIRREKKKLLDNINA